MSEWRTVRRWYSVKRSMGNGMTEVEAFDADNNRIHPDERILQAVARLADALGTEKGHWVHLAVDFDRFFQ